MGVINAKIRSDKGSVDENQLQSILEKLSQARIERLFKKRQANGEDRT
jgi:hypothetical protein